MAVEIDAIQTAKSIGWTDALLSRLAANSVSLNSSLTIAGGTRTTSVPVINGSQTWNDSGVTFTGIKLDVTNTASASGSKLLDLQTGAASRISFASIPGTGNFATGTGGLRMVFGTDVAIAYCPAYGLTVTNAAGTASLNIYANVVKALSGVDATTFVYTSAVELGSSSWRGLPEALKLVSGAGISWSSTTGLGGTADLFLFRDAANTLAQRNSTNAQTYRTYGTYTDASNYRRLALSMSTAGVATILPEGAGTGASGNVLHISGLPTANPGPGILWNNAGTPAIGT